MIIHRGLLARALLLAVALWAVPPAVDARAQGDSGVFSITPARRDVVGRPGKRLVPTEVANTTKQDLQVRVFPVLLSQDVTGQFTFSEDAADLRTAAKIVGAVPGAFDLPAGGRRKVALTWALLPSGDRTAFVGVVFESRATPKPGQVVRTIQRLLSVNFLRTPGHYRSSGRFTRIRAVQGAPRVLQIIPRLRNTGQLADVPRSGLLRIRDATGNVVLRQPWTGDVILPGYEREFPIEVSKVLPAGEYSARVLASFGDSRKITIATTFRLVGPNQLPTPKVTIADFRANGVIGGDSRATGVIRSVGTAPADTAVRVELFRLLPNGQQPPDPIKSQKLTFNAIPAGGSRNLAVVYPGLSKAAYRVIATYRESPGSIQRVQADFSPVARESFADKLKRFWREHRGLIFTVTGLLALLLIVAFLLRRQRRLEQRLRAAEGSTAPPTPEAPDVPIVAVPPAREDDRLLDLNRATVEDLRKVPGIGASVAAAIVAHRSSAGPFAAVDDLIQVKGIGPQKVTSLRGYLRV